jgi:hypothetical protein
MITLNSRDIIAAEEYARQGSDEDVLGTGGDA